MTKVRAAGERISAAEGGLSRTRGALAEVRNDLTRAGANTEGLLGVTRQIQEQLADAQTNLSELKAQAHAQGDLERRNADAEVCVKAMQDELEGRYSRALTMLDNSRRDMKEHAAKVGSRISGLRVNGAAPLAEPLELPLTPPVVQ